MKIKVKDISPNPSQPRRHIDEDELRSLAESIRQDGLINPIAVEEHGDRYYLIDGERRWRAHQLLGLQEISAEVRPALNGTGKTDRLILAVVANLQRTDLSPIEEAHAYEELIDIGLSRTEIAARLAVSNQRIVSRLRLLELDPPIQDLVDQGLLPLDRRATDAILSIEDPEDRQVMAKRLGREGITIKTIVKACRNYNKVLEQRRNQRPALGVPAVDIGSRKAGRDPEEKWPQWDIVAQSGALPPWPMLIKAAQATCDDCALRPYASPQTCAECPGMDLIRRLVERANAR